MWSFEGIVKYRITGVQEYTCGVYDQHAALTDMAMGAVLRAVRDHSFDELVASPPERRVATVLRRQVSKLGFDILAFTFTDIGNVRSLRLITHSADALSPAI